MRACQRELVHSHTHEKISATQIVLLKKEIVTYIKDVARTFSEQKQKNTFLRKTIVMKSMMGPQGNVTYNVLQCEIFSSKNTRVQNNWLLMRVKKKTEYINTLNTLFTRNSFLTLSNF